MIGLMSLAALNMSQVMVLCLGADGHIAVEPAGHKHCFDGSHMHDHDLLGWPADDHADVESDSCGTCIDIPFADEASNVSQRPRLACVSPAITWPLIPELHAPDAVGFASWLSYSPCRSASLRSTILQV